MTVGDIFGDFRVVRLLGKGGMGEVWLLKGTSGNPVAAKILEATADHDARTRFLREAELALGVRHPNLVEVYDVGEDPETGLCYILMEYVPGGTLADYIKVNGALAIEDAIAVVAAIASVLELGRLKRIVHRDIKPANIMFDAEGTPKLADLGIARVGNAGTETTTVTRTGMMIGTPAYMAPEQMFDSHHVDTRADIYSLGIVFFEMLAGERPNKGETIVQLMARAMKGEPIPDIRTVRKDVPAELARLINRMVVPNRANRLATPRQITTALTVIERSVRVSSSRNRDPQHWRLVVWRILLFVSLLAATVLTVLRIPPEFWPWSRPPADPEEIPEVETNDLPVIPPTPIHIDPLPPIPVPSPPRPLLPPPPAASFLQEPLPPVAAHSVLPSPSAIDSLPAPEVKPTPSVNDEGYVCEFVPRIKGWIGHVRYPAKIERISVKGCKSYEIVEHRKNSFGGVSVVISFRGNPLDLCFLTLEAEGKKRTVSVQLKHPMQKSMEVDLAD